MCIADDISVVWKMMWPLLHRNCTNVSKELAVSILKIAQVVGYPEESMLIRILIPLFWKSMLPPLLE
jgi:ABC-type molybdate transport system permease subunit